MYTSYTFCCLSWGRLAIIALCLTKYLRNKHRIIKQQQQQQQKNKQTKSVSTDAIKSPQHLKFSLEPAITGVPLPSPSSIFVPLQCLRFFLFLLWNGSQSISKCRSSLDKHLQLYVWRDIWDIFNHKLVGWRARYTWQPFYRSQVTTSALLW